LPDALKVLNVSENKKKFCVSLVDPQRPGWFIRHYNYYLQLESETSPQNAPLFDQDATFILIPDKFWPEFFALESYNYPDHYVYVTGDGRMRISKYAQKDEFHNSASFALADHFVKRMSCLPGFSGTAGRSRDEIR